MTRPRVPLGLEASRATLNRAVCLELGTQLAEARARRGLSISEVATLLGLSRAQVTALEQVHPEAYYGAEFYCSALKKYLIYMGFSPAEGARVLVGPASVSPAGAAPERRPRTSAAPALSAADGSATSYWRRLGVLATAAVAVSAVTTWWLLGSRATPSVEQPDTHAGGRPVREPAGANPAGRVVPAPAPLPPEATAAPLPAATSPAPTELVAVASAPAIRYGSVAVSRRTWIFVRYADNSVDERGLAAGESLFFRGQPVYLAVGAAAGTTVVVDGRPIDTAAFHVKGQIRIGRAFLGAQMAGG